jgi:hypothetical protein
MTPSAKDHPRRNAVTGGAGFIEGAMGLIGNVAYDIIKKESESGFVANAVRQTGNTPGK